MSAIRKTITVQQGSYEPIFWTVLDGDTGGPLDLTASGYEVTGVVATRPDGLGEVLATLDDATVWRRTDQGRVYFQPPSTVSSLWTFRRGYYQAELSHPSGQTVRFAEGPFLVSPELVKP